MSILQGFPPSNTISPSVRITEQDLSFIAPQQSFHSGALIGFASKGPINVPTLITSVRQLNMVFGYPHPETGDPYLIYGAQQYLQVANELYVLRVAETDAVSDEAATSASVDVPVSGGAVIAVSKTLGPYLFEQDSFFRWRVNGLLSSKTLVVMADNDEDEQISYTAATLAAELNSQLDPDIDGIIFADNGSGYIQVSTTYAFGPNASLEFVSVQNAIYGPDSVTGLGLGMTPAALTGAAAKYPNDSYQTNGHFDFTGLTNLALSIVVDGTDNVLIDNVVQVIDLSSLETTNTLSEIVIFINDQVTGGSVPGGFVASATGNNLTITTLTSGEDSQLLVKASSAGALFGFSGDSAAGTSPSGATGDSDEEDLGIISGSVDSDTITFTLAADSPGIEGNATQVVVTNDTADDGFRIDVYNNGVQVESWGNLTKDQSSSYYVETYLASVSDYIVVVDNTTTQATPANGTYTLSGGSDGLPSDPDEQDLLLVGNNVGYTGMYAFSEPDQIDIDILACPGHASTEVVEGLIGVAETRGDCIAIIDPPFGLTVSEIVAWQNGVHPLNSDRFDSDFAALYWPWLMLYDTFNAVNVWVPPSGSVMAVYANSDNLAAPWFAPAGLNRGIVPNVLDVYTRPTLEDRDEMYGNQNAINPIIQFPDVGGFVVWGQKTLQREPSALDRVNVRRLMFVAEKQIRQACRTLLFEPNDSKFQQQFESICNNILKQIQTGRGLTNYIIVDDSTLNTPDTIDRNEYWAQIGIQPTRAVEFIFIEFSVNPTGSFATASSSTNF